MAGNFSGHPRNSARAARSALPAVVRRLRAAPGDAAAKDARRFQFAALDVTGEHGYAALTVQAILDRAGRSRSRFYRLFADKDDCYASGYDTVSGALVSELLAITRSAEGWEAGFESGLEGLAALLRAEPALMRALVAEFHAVAAVRDLRSAVFERLSHAVDSARREIGSRHAPPPSSAQFILCTIEAAMVDALSAGEPGRFRTTIPELRQIAVAIYFG